MEKYPTITITKRAKCWCKTLDIKSANLKQGKYKCRDCGRIYYVEGKPLPMKKIREIIIKERNEILRLIEMKRRKII